MVNLTAIKTLMGRKKAEAVEAVEVVDVAEEEKVIHPLSIDTGREETNTIVAKLNEVIGYLNDNK